MNKIQRAWLGLSSLIVCVIPIIFHLIGEDIFINYQGFFFVGLIFEIIGLFVLLRYNKKFNNKKSRNFISIALVLLIMLMICILGFAYIMKDFTISI